MTRTRLAPLYPLTRPEESMPLTAPQPRQDTAAANSLERLVSRLTREADAYDAEEGSVPAAEVAALLRLLETQARAVLEEVSHG